MSSNVTLKIKGEDINGTYLRFSPFLCLAYDDGPADLRCLQLLASHLEAQTAPLAFYGAGTLTRYLLKHQPQLAAKIRVIKDDDGRLVGQEVHGVPVAAALPEDIGLVFLSSRRSRSLHRMQGRLPAGRQSLGLEVLAELDWRAVPEKAWIPKVECIYPREIPDLTFQANQDLILIDCPARNLALLPNGLAYVHNTLKRTSIKFQTVDLDLIAYHRYHYDRLLDNPYPLTPSGNLMLIDPWSSMAYDQWQNPEVIGYFKPFIAEIIEKLVAAAPKVLALSIQACNKIIAQEVVAGVKARLPETLILVGGYSCYQQAVGLKAFPECDYMVIGEADLTLGALVEALARGERPTGLPGVMSRFDPPDMKFTPGPMPENLDELDMVNYEFSDLSLYVNWDGYKMAPIIATRGCRWSLCTFCAERFHWRARSPEKVVDEFEWLNSQGFDTFVFNESDLNGKPEILLAICDEIIRRKLEIKLTGQLRINKKSDRAFFEKLRKAGFCSLRFGVDAWSKNTLKLQKKGYTPAMIAQNLRDCSLSGIVTEVNTVVGVPGETDEDIQESIDLMIACKPYIWRHANINHLLLVAGSVYWEEPDKHNVVFRGDMQEIFAKYPTIVPDEVWYSTEPYIDGPIRRERYLRVVRALEEKGIEMNAFVQKVTKAVEAGIGSALSARPEQVGEMLRKKEKKLFALPVAGEKKSGCGSANSAPPEEDDPSEPDLAELLKQLYESEQPDPSKATPVEQRVAAGASTARTPVRECFRVVKLGEDFLGVHQSHGLEAGLDLSGAGVREAGRFHVMVKNLFRQGVRLAKDPELCLRYASRALAILKTEGPGSVVKKARGIMRRAEGSRTLVVAETITGRHLQADPPLISRVR